MSDILAIRLPTFRQLIIALKFIYSGSADLQMDSESFKASTTSDKVRDLAKMNRIKKLCKI